MTVTVNPIGFHELADEAFLLVSKCEHLARKSDGFIWNNVFSDDTINLCQGEKEAHDVIKPFIDSLGDRFNAVLNECGYRCSVIVYFMPGTWTPLPVFVPTRQFNGTNAYCLWKKNIGSKVDEISAELRHAGMPIAKKGKKNKSESHVFFFAYQYVSLVGQAGKKVSDNVDFQHGVVGNSGLSVWLDLNKPPGNKYELSIQCEKEYLGELCWEKGRNVPLRNNFLFISPVFLNEDTMVLMASYFDRKKLIKIIESTEDAQRILGVHGSLARQVFSPLYTAMLRGDMARLRMNLSRNNISSALLDCAAEFLNPPSDGSSGFFYTWKDDNDILRYSNDFRWSIYGDIIRHPDSIFTHVRFLEDRLYETIQKDPEWGKIATKSNPIALPSAMPLSDLLRAVEELGRALGTTDRDHLLHQFQVFIFGTLIIRTEGEHFLKMFAKSLFNYCDIGDPAQRDKCFKANDFRLILLLQSAWFLVSTCHDVGRPVQMVDTIVESLQEKVGQLVQLDSKALGVFPRFKVDSILYDDPRTYLLLRELAISIATWLGASDKMEDWWYFFRYMAFEKKNHAFTSALALGLSLTEKIQRHEFALLFTRDQYGRFIASQILLPIVLHHSYDWNIELDELNDKVRNAPQQKKKNVREAVDTIRKFIDDTDDPHVRFEEFPLAVLLAITDYLQEAGRPSGSKKEYWPDALLPDVQMWEKEGHLNLSYEYILQYPDKPPHTKSNDKKAFHRKQNKDILIKQERSNCVRAIFDLKALKNVFLSANGIHLGGYVDSIFKYKGDSFCEKL